MPPQIFISNFLEPLPPRLPCFLRFIRLAFRLIKRLIVYRNSKLIKFELFGYENLKLNIKMSSDPKKLKLESQCQHYPQHFQY
jgi:hypothetical protein